MAGLVLEIQQNGGGDPCVILVDASWTIEDLHEAVQIVHDWPGELLFAPEIEQDPYAILEDIFVEKHQITAAFQPPRASRITVTLRERIASDVQFPSLLSSSNTLPVPAAFIHNELAGLAEPILTPVPRSFVEAMCHVSPTFRTLYDESLVEPHQVDAPELSDVVTDAIAPRLRTALAVFADGEIEVPEVPEDDIDPRLTTMLLDLGMDIVESPELILISTAVDCLESAELIHDPTHYSVYSLTRDGEEALENPELFLDYVLKELITGYSPDEVTVALMDAMASLIGRETAAELIDTPVGMLDITLSTNPELPPMGTEAETIPVRANALRDMWGLQEPSQVNGAPPELNYAGAEALRYAVGRALGAIEEHIQDDSG